MTHRTVRLVVIALAVISALHAGGARAAQRAHGATHSRYAAELARRIVVQAPGNAPLVLVDAVPADASHHRALALRLRNTSDRAIAAFTWQWSWHSQACPALMQIIGAPGAYGGGSGAGGDASPAIEAGQVVTVYVSPEHVRDLLRTTRKRCHHGPSVRFELTSVRYVDGSRSEAEPAARPAHS